MKQDNTVHSERKFSSLDDIRAYKEELLEQIRQDRDVISTKWNDLFHREEPTPQSKAQKIMKMLSMGTGVLYNHQIVNVLQGRTAPTPSGDTAGRASTRNRGDAYHYQQPVTSKPGRRCGHGRHSRPWLCEWEGGRSPPGMSEANLPWPHLRPGRVETTT